FRTCAIRISSLVIDDLHELPSPDALAQLTRLLTNLPGGVHAVLATRRDLSLRLHQVRLGGAGAEERAAAVSAPRLHLSLGLHQLRLAGELGEIRGADLRFRERETRELLDASGVALT